MRITGEIRTYHGNARCVAKSVSADNLTEMNTRAEEHYVVTRVTSSRIRSVIASIDDYLSNITVAEDICRKPVKIADSKNNSDDDGNLQE